MLVEETLRKLNHMKLHGMVLAFHRWLDEPKDKDLEPSELLGLLTDAEWVNRENRRLESRLRNAKLRQTACLEDIDYSHARGLSKAMMHELATCRWVSLHHNIVLTGPTGMGKSYLACALGNKACREGHTVAYRRTSRLLEELSQARADGTYHKLLQRLAKTNVLILDDFGLEILTATERKDLLEVLEDRYNTSATIITSQREPKDWHAIIGDETIADGICDRVLHNAHKLKLLPGESMRKSRGLEK